jgi:drug/metabolite transporter (DMT)-like permease
MTPRGWAAFAACSLIWGIPYLFIKIAVDDGVPPVFVAWSRMVLGAVVLGTLAARSGVLGQVRGRWRWIAVYAVVELAIPFPLIAIGEQHVSSSLAAILIATVPLFVALLALRFDHEERADVRRMTGLVVGLGGVVVLMGVDVAGRTDELLGALAVLLAAFGYAAGPMLLKRKLDGIDARALMCASLVVAAGALTPFVMAAPPTEVPSADGLVSLVVLGVVCTALALVVFAVLIREVGTRPRADHHLRQPARGGRARGGGARRAPGRRGRRRAAADPRGLVAGDRVVRLIRGDFGYGTSSTPDPTHEELPHARTPNSRDHHRRTSGPGRRGRLWRGRRRGRRARRRQHRRGRRQRRRRCRRGRR